jgi:hypothetical protein
MVSPHLQCIHPNRLHQIVIGAGGQCLRQGLTLIVGRDYQHQAPFPARKRAQAAADLQPIQARQPHIEQHDVVKGLAIRRQRGFAVSATRHVMAAQPQRLFERGAGNGFVFDN